MCVLQGFTYPVRAHFLEDLLEMTGYKLTSFNQIDDYGQEKMWKTQKQLAPRKRKNQITALVEVCFNPVPESQYISFGCTKLLMGIVLNSSVTLMKDLYFLINLVVNILPLFLCNFSLFVCLGCVDQHKELHSANRQKFFRKIIVTLCLNFDFPLERKRKECQIEKSCISFSFSQNV